MLRVTAHQARYGSFERRARRVRTRASSASPAISHACAGNRRGRRQGPDLLLLIRDPSGRSAAIVIEIKHSSGKHNLESNGVSIGPAEMTLETEISSVASTYKAGDQLADYFVALLDNQIRLRAGRASAELEKVVREHQAILASVPQHAKFLRLDGGRLQNRRCDSAAAFRVSSTGCALRTRNKRGDRPAGPRRSAMDVKTYLPAREPILRSHSSEAPLNLYSVLRPDQQTREGRRVALPDRIPAW